MKKIVSFLILCISLFIGSNVYANDIESIEMDIYVSKDGNARVTEKWVTDTDDGTEVYKQYYNTGESIISNLKVSMDGTEFTTLDKWDVDGTFNDKKYKAGINDVTDGVEICFGISEYGENTYTFTYDISNFVVGIDDKDMIYWTLIPKDLGDKPEDFYIKVHSDFKYADSDEIWGYGYEGGYAYVYDGYIELTSDKNLDNNEYVVLLAEFSKGTFNPSVIMDNDSDYYEDLAANGSYRDGDETSVFEAIIGFISLAVPFMVIIIVVVIAANQNDCGTKKLVFKKEDKKLGKDIMPFRDIPYKKDIYKAYWMAGNYKLIKNKNDFLGAILLKWLKDGIVETVKTESKILKKENNAIKFNGITKYNCSKEEKELYDHMYEASIDGILENNEFKTWCQENYSDILSWFNKVFDCETENLVAEGFITKEGNKYLVDSRVKAEALKMAGLKEFFKEFTMIDEKEAIEVKVWKDYLIFAQILGMAKTVAKQFKKLYPDLIPEDTYNDFMFIYLISYDGVNAATTAKTRAESYDAGGGGMSFGGGGGGSFGGGGGGGFR